MSFFVVSVVFVRVVGALRAARGVVEVGCLPLSPFRDTDWEGF